MPRQKLTDEQQDAGAALGAALRKLRGDRSAEHVATASGIGVDTLRKMERGIIPTPGFFAVASLATEIGVSLDRLFQLTQQPARLSTRKPKR